MELVAGAGLFLLTLLLVVGVTLGAMWLFTKLFFPKK